MSMGEFGKARVGRDPDVGGDESLEVVGLHGDRLDTAKERLLSIIVEWSVRSPQSVVLEGIEKIPDDLSGLVGPSYAVGGRAATAVSLRGVLVRVQEPNRVVNGEAGVLKGWKATPGNAPQTPLGHGTVREWQEILVGPVSVLHEGESVV